VNGAEADFWTALEYRITSELWGFEDQILRSLWCDGLVPEEYDLRSDRPCIRGTAYCGQTGQERWRFTLLVSDHGPIDWSALLPPESVTGWLSVHPRERALIVDPASAYAL
jgi:hypothetical protein